MATGELFHTIPRALLIDWDGTLADTMPCLYAAYRQFADRMGFAPTIGEFQELTGPPLKDIVPILRKRYLLQESEEALLQLYIGIAGEKIKGASLKPGAFAFIEKAYAEGCRLALVTAAPLSLIAPAIEREGVKHFFDCVVAADDVKFGKPHPEPYIKALQLLDMPPHEGIAIEDTEAGLASARGAGLSALFFTSWEEIAKKVPARYGWQPLHKEISVTVDNSPVSLAPALEQEIDRIWQKETYKHPHYFDGSIFSVEFSSEEGIIGRFVPFRQVVAGLVNQEIKQALNLRPASVSGVTRFGQEVLIAKRTDRVLQYPNCFELPPAGGLDEYALAGDRLDYKKTLALELLEECGIGADIVRDVEAIGIAFDRWHSVFDLCTNIHLDPYVDKPLCQDNSECTDFQWLSETDAYNLLMAYRNSVPLSRLLLMPLR